MCWSLYVHHYPIKRFSSVKIGQVYHVIYVIAVYTTLYNKVAVTRDYLEHSNIVNLCYELNSWIKCTTVANPENIGVPELLFISKHILKCYPNLLDLF